MAKNRDWTPEAMQLWSMLVLMATFKDKPRPYAEIGLLVGVWQRNMGLPLGMIQDYCKRNALPPLQALVVNKETGYPTCGGYAADTNWDEVYKSIYEFGWHTVPNPFVHRLINPAALAA